MNAFTQFTTVDAWRMALGFLPMPMRAVAENRYVLLNGSTGNFCLDFIGGVDPGSQRDIAWSCDVGHMSPAVTIWS